MSKQIETADMKMVDNDLQHTLFDKTALIVQDTISEEHRRLFNHDPDPANLINDLRSASKRIDVHQSTRVAARTFSVFVRHFAPYFNILSTCITVQSQWPGSFWGVLRLLFRVTSDHAIFLEKVAHMFEALTNHLPAYGQIYAACCSGDAQVNSTEDKDLSTFLSYIYADIISMCLDIYSIFLRGLRGPQWHHLTFSVPPPSSWRPIDSRFAHFEARVAEHRQWLDFEARNNVQVFADIEERRTKYVTFLQRQDEEKAAVTNGVEQHRLSKRLKRVEKVQTWIQNSSLSGDGTSSINQSQDYVSNEHFLRHQKYRQWKQDSFDNAVANDSEDLRHSWSDRILFVQAQGGFGKSILAGTIIEDLRSEVENIDIKDDPPCLAFFLGSSKHHNAISSDDVFRELTLQLLRSHRHSHTTLDAVCLLLRKTSFKEHASPNDVLNVLAVLLRQHPTFLLIDGLDQLADVTECLTSLARLCRGADSRVLLLSRPNIKIPLEYQKWASDAPHIVLLGAEENREAIEAYLTQGLGLLATTDHYALRIEQDLVSQITSVADGSFLWADFFLEYLHFPTLTQDDTLVVLQHIESLRGLEALYGLILEALESRPLPEKRIIKDVLRWLSYSIHGLCTSALRTALSTSLQTAELEEIFPTTDIIDALPHLTCGLVNIKDDNVCFSHISISEYLQSMHSRNSEFSLYDESGEHAHLAARCLSYLAHKLPKRPLCGLSPQIRPLLPSSSMSQRTTKSGDSGYKSLSSTNGDNRLPQPAIATYPHSPSQNSIRTISFDTNLPFLRYASLCWPIHLSRAISPTHDTHNKFTFSQGSLFAIPYLFALSAFLFSRTAVTAWVEASLRYNLPPTLTRLVGPLSDLKAEIPPDTVEGRELRLVVNELAILSEKLKDLKDDHASALRENPSLIWQMDTIGQQDYWPVWE